MIIACEQAHLLAAFVTFDRDTLTENRRSWWEERGEEKWATMIIGSADPLNPESGLK